MFSFALSTLLLAASVTPDVGYSAEMASILQQVDNHRAAPIRSRRPWMVGGEFGINGLTGLGLNVSYNVSPYFSIDSGAGVGLSLARVGVRTRYNLFQSPLTPFVGVGAMYAFALDQDITSDLRGKSIKWRTDSAPFLQAVAGLAYTANNGFTLLANVGWAQLLRDTSNVKVLTPNATAGDRRTLDLMLGSGPVAALTLGYSF